jgi:hypothetical protein
LDKGGNELKMGRAKKIDNGGNRRECIERRGEGKLTLKVA